MKTNIFFNKNRQAGMTLIEASVWFVLFALVIAGALKMYTSVSSSQTTSAMTTDVIALRSAAQGLFSGSPGGYGAAATNLNSVLITANKIPASIKVSGAVLTNEQQGTITITAAGPGSFTLVETALTADVCTGLLSNMASQGFTTIATTGTTVPASFSPGSAITPTTAAGACATATTATVTFTSA